MKNIFTLLFVFWTMSLGLVNLSQACDSYDSAYPPPYPDNYPCMSYVLNNYSACCNVEFDAYCIEKLKEHCDNDGNAPAAHFPDGDYNNDCWFDQCLASGANSRPMPHCPQTCPSYESSFPPPGPNPPANIDGIIFEVIWYDGYCCDSEWDNACNLLLDSLAIAVGLCNDQDPSTVDGCHPSLGCTHTPAGAAPIIQLQMQAILEGPYVPATGLMRTDLRDKGILPLTQPFNTAPWNYNGAESVASIDDFPPGTVDWVMVEIRDGADKSSIVAQQAAILLEDGIIVNHDYAGGTYEGMIVEGAFPNSNYSVAVVGRNHLDVMTPIPIFLSNQDVYSFVDGAEMALTTSPEEEDEQLTEVNFLIYALHAGDMDGDGTLINTDYTNYYLAQSASVSGYYEADLNMDGQVTIADFNLYQPHAGLLGVSFLFR